MRISSFLVACALALTALPACTNSGGSTTTETACDPLAAKPITLGAVVGVGKDAAGTLYVDAANGIFVSGGGKLVRQHVTGTGQSGSNEYIFEFEPPDGDASTARDLLVETTGATADAMALAPPGGKAFLGQPGTNATALTLVDPSTVSGLPLLNTPNVVDYVADVSNGDVLLTTLPMNDDATSSSGGLALFYGPPSAVAQRLVTSYEMSHGATGTLTFLVDGTPYVLELGTTYGPDAGPLGAFTLNGLTPQGGATLGTTLRSPTPTSLPAGLSFTCLP
jgi:hypothetical protein